MTRIEWTEATWNPIVGCSVVSPGCTNCYAMRMAHRLGANPATPHYAGTTAMTRGGPVWTGKMALAPDSVLTAPLRRRKPTTYFVNSMGDLFHEEVPEAWIDQVFAVMALCPQHRFQILTKRADRMRDYMNGERYGVVNSAVEIVSDTRGDVAGLVQRENMDRSGDWPLPNVWLGVSAEDQDRADQRIPDLLATPAAVRFVSCEPLLGPVDLTRLDALIFDAKVNAFSGQYDWRGGPKRTETAKLDWVIVGGESGPGARPMHPDWARSMRDQCVAAGVPFFFKQWGKWLPVYDRDEDPDWRLCDSIARGTPNGRWMNLKGGRGFHGDRVVRMYRVDKARAGRLLDGREWNEVPYA